MATTKYSAIYLLHKSAIQTFSNYVKLIVSKMFLH